MVLVFLTSKVFERVPLVPILLIGMVGLLLIPFASTLPDGLESVTAYFIQ